MVVISSRCETGAWIHKLWCSWSHKDKTLSNRLRQHLLSLPACLQDCSSWSSPCLSPLAEQLFLSCLVCLFGTCLGTLYPLHNGCVEESRYYQVLARKRKCRNTHTAGGNAERYNHFGKQAGFSPKAKDRVDLWFSNLAPKCMLLGGRWPHIKLCRDKASILVNTGNIVNAHQQMSRCIHSMKHYLVIKRKEVLIDICCDIGVA